MDKRQTLLLLPLLFAGCSGESKVSKTGDMTSSVDHTVAHDAGAKPHDAASAPTHTPTATPTPDEDAASSEMPVEPPVEAPGEPLADPPFEMPAAGVTYYQHAKPVIDAKCVRCHVEGTVAPFALNSYELSKKWMKHAMPYIQANTMPPWKFDKGCNEYQGDYSVTDSEKQMLSAWLEGGLLEGDRKSEAPALDIGDKGLSRVDVTLQLPEPYLPTEHPDHYRCFPVKWDEPERSFMTGFRAVPGNPKIVHHVEVYHVTARDAATIQRLDDEDPGPGYTCFGGPGAGDGTIGGWAPGSPGYDYPDGIGIAIDPGAVIVVQVHYNSPEGTTEPDRTKVELKVDKDVTPGGYDFWTNVGWSAFRQMSIKAGNPAANFTWPGDPTTLAGGKPILVYTAALHMHNLGHTGYMKVKHQDGSEECLLQISDWDFHWQGGVRLKKPIAVNVGDQVEVSCTFDNSQANQPVGADGTQQAPRDVNWGENTSDEMCLGILLWGPQAP